MRIITAGGNILICDPRAWVCVYGQNYYALVALILVCLPKWGLETRLQTTAKCKMQIYLKLSTIHRISKVIRGVLNIQISSGSVLAAKSDPLTFIHTYTISFS